MGLSSCSHIQEIVCQGYEPEFEYGAILGRPEDLQSSTKESK